jgi:hypothetical protein
MDEGRKDHLQMIQGIIDRMAQNSFRLKGSRRSEASLALCAVAARPCLLAADAWYLRRERLFRRLFDHVRTKDGPPDFSMDVRPFAGEVGPVLAVAMSRTIIGFYGPVLFVAIALAVILPR